MTSCTITFGLPDNLQSYTWTGELGFLEEEVVELVALDETLWSGEADLDLTLSPGLRSERGHG